MGIKDRVRTLDRRREYLAYRSASQIGSAAALCHIEAELGALVWALAVIKERYPHLFEEQNEESENARP